MHADSGGRLGEWDTHRHVLTLKIVAWCERISIDRNLARTKLSQSHDKRALCDVKIWVPWQRVTHCRPIKRVSLSISGPSSLSNCSTNFDHCDRISHIRQSNSPTDFFLSVFLVRILSHTLLSVSLVQS